ncbi:Sterol biosynthesis ERG24/DHCR-like - like 5 [Theobroma cacao]|nr:Sterol biosynthesis ERG24/DHCR-like - like 5 [Theobroma cacao]
MTSTWDIIAERVGFMLLFRDLVWIPFTFSIQDLLLALSFSLPCGISFLFHTSTLFIFDSVGMERKER